MPNFQFIGQSPRFYGDIVTDTGSLVAEPGDVRTFDVPPSDGLWVETDKPEVIPPFRPWPPRPSAPEAPAEVAPEITTLAEYTASLRQEQMSA